MDVKGLAWIGNIYQKFEAMCMEIEEVMYEDTVKYVENQVQTVGSTVKRFYSDVMQDLNSESYIDPVKVAGADLSLNPYAHSELKVKASAKKDGRETDGKLNDDSKVITGKANTGVYRRPIANRKGNLKGNLVPLVPAPVAPISGTKSSLSSSFQLKRSREVASGDVVSPARLVGVPKSTAGKISKPVVDTVRPICSGLVNPPATAGSVIGTEQKQADSASNKICSPDTTTTPGSTASAGLKEADHLYTAVNSADISTISSAATNAQKPADCASTHYSGGLSLVSTDAGTCVKNGVASPTEGSIFDLTDDADICGEDIIFAHQERLDGCSLNAAKNNDALDSEVEIVEPFNDSILEETCVMVEGDKLHAVPQGKGIHKSYKKKFREAFSSRTRLTRKEYEQLAAKYIGEESDQVSAETVIPDLPVDSSTKMVAVQSSESEWELL